VNNIETIFLGIVQGLTEFLPVSSSGHLVIFKNLLGMKEPEILLDASLHLGTLIAVCIYFRKDLVNMVTELWSFVSPGSNKEGLKPNARLAMMVVLGTVPTAIIGLAFKDSIEKAFGSLFIVGIMLLITGVIVGITRFIPKAHCTATRVGPLIALAIGVAQGLAIMPGISRSGSTIVCALLLGLNRELAGRFSFLLAIPAILGAVVLQLDADAIQRVGVAPLILGLVSSGIIGFLALKLLMGIVKKGHFYYFAPYCWGLGLLTLYFS
jgi:undecaprenyl-diphosphatase